MKLNEYNNIKYYIGENAQDNWDLFEKSKELVLIFSYCLRLIQPYF